MSRHTAFAPLVHGFRFVNSFAWRWPLSQRRALTFGLCGGMCCAALDYWRLGWLIPQQETPPTQGQPLYRYLQRRQIASIGGLTLPRLMRRILAGQATNEALTRAVWPRLRAKLDAGIPVMLVVVRTHGLQNPFDNHQVLCTGYDMDPEARWLDLAIYDPIYPCEPIWLHLDLGEAAPLDLRHSRGDRVRGLFLGRYRLAMPPRTG